MSAEILKFTGRVMPISPEDIEHMRATRQMVMELREQRSLEREARSYLHFIIEHLIEIADDLDGDPDLEDGADREIAWCESAGRGPWNLPAGTTDDDEDSDPAAAFEDDNGLGDADGRDEQGADRHRRRRT